MARIDANTNELRQAARSHRTEADRLDRPTTPPTRSAVLLRFYGVECGMKAKYLLDTRKHTTQDIPVGLFGADGHDIKSGMKVLGVPPTVGRPPQSLRLKRDKKKKKDDIGMASSHQALRYGVDIEDSDYIQLNEWLSKMLVWLHESGVA